MYEDTDPWPIKCHICLNEFTVEVGRMKAEKELRCPDCGGRLEYTAKQFESKLAEHIDESTLRTGHSYRFVEVASEGAG